MQAAWPKGHEAHFYHQWYVSVFRSLLRSPARCSTGRWSQYMLIDGNDRLLLAQGEEALGQGAA
jgi:hypothetical protein